MNLQSCSCWCCMFLHIHQQLQQSISWVISISGSIAQKWYINAVLIWSTVLEQWLFIELTNCILLVQKEVINKDWDNCFELAAFHHIKHLVCLVSRNPNFETNCRLDSSCPKISIVAFFDMFYTLVELSCMHQNLDSMVSWF